MHGRRVSAWKVVLISVLVLIIAVLAAGYVFVQTYVPDVDDDPHFAQIGTDSGMSLAYTQGMYKYNISRALKMFGENLQKQLEGARAPEIVRVDGIYNFLLLGHDKVALNTDVIMIASFDTNDGSISIMQLPRDTYIEYDGYAHRVNSMFAYLVGRARLNGAENVYHTALANYCDVLENAFSIELDNYALINLQAFESIVDIVGGVPVDVPEAMHYDDEFQGLSIHIEAGPQVLDGKTAAGFVRFRSGYLQADIGRQNAQKLFMTAFLKRVQETFSVNTVTKIVEQALKNLTTDLTITDAVYYAKEALSVDLSNMNMMTLPGEAIYSGGVSYYVINRKNTLEIINEYFNVYNTDITDEMFDRDLLFTDGNGTKIDGIYRSSDSEYVVSNGESLDKNGIYIPRYYGSPEVEEDVSTETVPEAVTEPESVAFEETEAVTYENESFEDTETQTESEDSTDTKEDVSVSEDTDESDTALAEIEAQTEQSEESADETEAVTEQDSFEE